MKVDIKVPGLPDGDDPILWLLVLTHYQRLTERHTRRLYDALA